LLPESVMDAANGSSTRLFLEARASTHRFRERACSISGRERVGAPAEKSPCATSPRKTIETTAPTDGQFYASLCTGEKTIPDNFIARHVSLSLSLSLSLSYPSEHVSVRISVRASGNTYAPVYRNDVSRSVFDRASSFWKTELHADSSILRKQRCREHARA